ncbi:hypothetical protein [Sphingomonas jatrophae]|uniref:Uncharacterized protein n=1 Tax=Sphingomonas jatrophae TaxID=1166337 RepID=A0A1I6L2C5_9SPHN|nr:hypothetical protein [Sphingomonas jatrophae]SFR97592.1 hypothetical protein SAMN05192580_2183 [Sphingomonas jatrophae]
MSEKQDAGHLKLQRMPGKTDEQTMAYTTLLPHVRHAYAMGRWAGKGFPEGQPGIQASVDIVTEQCSLGRAGNLGPQIDLLVTQAMTLDAAFTDLMNQASVNMGKHPDAVDRYLRLAMKAQAQSRATIEALAAIHRPREQTVRHVHVHEGGQAVVADEFHHHAAGGQIENDDGQAHAAGAGKSPECTALPCADPVGAPLPIPHRAGKEEVPDARRRTRKRRTEGQ